MKIANLALIGLLSASGFLFAEADNDDQVKGVIEEGALPSGDGSFMVGEGASPSGNKQFAFGALEKEDETKDASGDAGGDSDDTVAEAFASETQSNLGDTGEGSDATAAKASTSETQSNPGGDSDGNNGAIPKKDLFSFDGKEVDTGVDSPM